MGAPLVAAGFGAGTSLIGAGINIFGQQQQAQEQSTTALENARLARLQAGQTAQAGAQRGADIVEQGRDVAGSAQAVAAASGLRGGTIDNLFAVSEANAARDAARVRQTAARQEQALRLEASQSERRARAIQQAGVLGSIGTGISGFGGAAGQIIGAL